MIISHESELEAVQVTHPEALNAAMKVLVGPEQGWEGYVMRIFELKKGGHTPKHAHPWPHINLILEGKGKLFLDDQENGVTAGSFAYVPSNEEHQFKNEGDGIFRFMCIVPKVGHK